MHRGPILDKLRRYVPADDHEEAMRQRIIRFVEEHADCFERSQLAGHITASALVVNRRQTHTLLTHHRALNKWLQPGGHADGDPDPLNVALREAREESGLRSVVPLGNDLFDVDVHPIPARGDVPAHFHYDIRFLFEADDTEPVAVSGESHDVRWISFDELAQYTDEESILRMVRKVRKRRG